VGAQAAEVKPRVVLDTNVVVSALLFARGSLGWIRREWRSGTFIPLGSRDTVLEIVRVLAYPKFALSDGERELLLGDYLPYCATVEIRPRRRKVSRCRDPRDEIFLDLAADGDADLIVTGDRDLLAVPRFRVPIVTPVRFQELLATGSTRPR
jgi:uncharacterized protein